jgi:hypothetical protein
MYHGLPLDLQVGNRVFASAQSAIVDNLSLVEFRCGRLGNSVAQISERAQLARAMAEGAAPRPQCHGLTMHQCT